MPSVGAVCRWLVLSAVSLAPMDVQASQAPCAVPASIGDGWEAATPEASGFDSERLCALLASVAHGDLNLHGLVIERRGRLVAELYRGGKDKSVYGVFAHETEFGPTVLHDTRSVGKSVVSLLVGIVRQRGQLGDLSTPAVDFYPEYPDLATSERKAIELVNLLTMSSGLEWSEGGGLPNDETRLFWKWSPYWFVLSRPIVAPPGSTFNYNSGGTAVLADVLTRVTGTPLKALARESLFEPLGIRDWEWVADLHGRPMAFTGLRMRPRDMAKLGRLVLDQGQWRGQQIVPVDWIAASLQPRLETGFDGLRYGYQWWTGSVDWNGRTLAWSAAFGNGGQRVFIVPELDLCVVVTAGAYDDLQAVRLIQALFNEIVSMVQP